MRRLGEDRDAQGSAGGEEARLAILPSAAQREVEERRQTEASERLGEERPGVGPQRRREGARQGRGERAA
jgi:hypothetical protein